MSTIDHREEARYRQDVLVSYRAWLSYLEAQHTLLAASGDATSGDPFEGLSRSGEQAEVARQRIAALPADKRELFDAIYEQDRQLVQRSFDAEAPVRGGTVKRIDPDEVARHALARLLEEARGLHRNDRRGMVPRGKPDAVKWLALDLSDVTQAAPSETDYELAAGRKDARRGMLVNIVFAVLALVAIPGLFFLLRQPPQPATRTATPSGNGALLTPWPVQAVEAFDPAWTLAVQAVDSRWPATCASELEARDSAASACWLRNSFRPLELCLPAERMTGLQSLRVEAVDSLPSRFFTLAAGDASAADLVVSPCDDAADVAPLLGRLQGVEPAAELAVGAEALAGFRLTEMATRGRGEDPSLASGSLTLTVVVHDPDLSRDWGALAPTLLLADGSVASPSDRAQDGEVRRLSYLIPEQSEPFDVRWQVAVADQVVRYRATLEPPPSRDAVLRTQLRVEDLTVTPSQQTMTVTLTLHNTATTPLVVETADFGFQTSAGRRELAVSALRQPLAPDERRVVTLELPLQSGTLQVGPFPFELVVGR
jgi:hypothetical protein